VIKLKALILAYRIEFRWLFVILYRRLMEKLYANGEELNSPKMLHLYGRLSRHTTFIMKAEQKYEQQYFPIVGGVL